MFGILKARRTNRAYRREMARRTAEGMTRRQNACDVALDHFADKQVKRAFEMRGRPQSKQPPIVRMGLAQTSSYWVLGKYRNYEYIMTHKGEVKCRPLKPRSEKGQNPWVRFDVHVREEGFGPFFIDDVDRFIFDQIAIPADLGRR